MSTGCSLTWDVMRDRRQHIPCLLFGISHFVTLTSTNLPLPRLYLSSKSHTNSATCIVPPPRALWSVELHQDNLLCADWSGRRALLYPRLNFSSKSLTNPATCIVPPPRALWSVELHQDNLPCADWSGRRALLHLGRFSFISKFILFTFKNFFQVPWGVRVEPMPTQVKIYPSTLNPSIRLPSMFRGSTECFW